ncbi:hypothetical protein Tco_0204657 [Tanacetum coccineum]
MEDGNWKSYRFKEDQPINLQYYLSRDLLPDHVTTRDLWKVCNDYGVVVALLFSSSSVVVVERVQQRLIIITTFQKIAQTCKKLRYERSSRCDNTHDNRALASTLQMEASRSEEVRDLDGSHVLP